MKRNLPEGTAKTTARVLLVALITVVAGAARADEGSGPRESRRDDNAYGFGLALTIGEGMVFVHKDVYRGPFSLELVPSFGWSWFKFDLGLSTTLESIQVAGTHAGRWNFTFRPGARLTPPMIPLYLRFAVPLQIQRHDFDYGLLFGLGVDIHLVWILGLVIEVDTTLSKHLSWGGSGVPLEFRAGISLHRF